MRVIIIGAGGQLGSDLGRVLVNTSVLPLAHKHVDIVDRPTVRRLVRETRPDVVINTAAFHPAEACEEQPDKAFDVNTLAVHHLARVCADQGCSLVHLSTAEVFDGDHSEPYLENASPNPVNVLGASKLAGEMLVRQACPKHFIIRTSGLYGVAGAGGKGGNFVEFMIRFAHLSKPIRVGHEQILAPTYTKDLAACIRELIQTNAYGLYHVTNSGQCSWHEFAECIFYLLNIRANLTPTSVSAGATAKVRRPSYSVLAHHSLARAGLSVLRPWHQALAEYLRERGHLQTAKARAA
jgi:dTDP-4-dehydrorhamnose reductase